jgi:Lsr2
MQEIRRYLTDDLAAAENPGAPEVMADRTTRITVDGEAWEIDLSPGNRERLMEDLGPYCRAGRRVREPGKHRPKADRDRSARIREWAKERGIKVNPRGRIPAGVEEEYKKEASPV